MATRSPPRWSWALGAALLAAAGSAWIVQAELKQRRADFDTDARIAHRLLSQQAAQQDAVLATLTLLQPGGEAGSDADQRLSALYPQLLQVARRGRDEAWSASAGEPARLAAAEAQSRTLGRAVLAAVDPSRGQYTLLRAGQPASYALRIDMARMVPWAEWPLPREGPVHAELRLGAGPWLIQPGLAPAGPWLFGADKVLASDSQNFELRVSRVVAWTELPWPGVAAWCLASMALVLGLATWRRQRAATRRAQELLRLGQVGRLNALGEMAAGMAHELNQPLTAVLASTQAAQRLLDDETPDLATLRQALQHSAQQARRAGEVVGRLRRLVQVPDADAAPQDLALAPLLRNVLDLVHMPGVQPELGGLDEALRVRADPVALEQLLHNLLLNAVQALDRVPPHQRRLAIASRVDADQVQLVVQDSGPGFSAEALARAFEPFFTTRAGGLGLGLSLCETLAIGMGGALTARNRPEGGAELTLSLPRAATA